jgi:prophage DNA circulation protein
MKLTGQSLYKEKQMRKSLQNAKEALAISESYRETVNQLELANSNTLRKTKEHLTAYLTQVVWLSQHSNKFNEAIKSFSDSNKKDQFMFDLLKQHVNSFNLKEERSEDAWKLELEPVSIQLGL